MPPLGGAAERGAGREGRCCLRPRRGLGAAEGGAGSSRAALAAGEAGELEGEPQRRQQVGRGARRVRWGRRCHSVGLEPEVARSWQRGVAVGWSVSEQLALSWCLHGWKAKSCVVVVLK